jgi:hypothetical protein
MPPSIGSTDVTHLGAEHYTQRRRGTSVATLANGLGASLIVTALAPHNQEHDESRHEQPAGPVHAGNPPRDLNVGLALQLVFVPHPECVGRPPSRPTRWRWRSMRTSPRTVRPARLRAPMHQYRRSVPRASLASCGTPRLCRCTVRHQQGCGGAHLVPAPHSVPRGKYEQGQQHARPQAADHGRSGARRHVSPDPCFP